MELHVGDFGTILRATIQDGDTPVDLSTATTLEFRLQPPSGAAEIVKTATLIGDGTDGRVEYVVEAGLLSVAGNWRYRARVVTPQGQWSSEEKPLQVESVF